jgi:hypothetical protein
MAQDTGITAIAHVIQLAVAPVFLLTGVGALLGVLASRLARINHAIGLSVTCALLVCAVIVALFAGAFLATDLSTLIGILFIAAMCAHRGARQLPAGDLGRHPQSPDRAGPAELGSARRTRGFTGREGTGDRALRRR